MNTQNLNKLLVGLLAALLVLAAIPSAQAAAAPNAGTFVAAGDVDASYTYAAGGAPHVALCFVDLNNDAGQQPGEPLYLTQLACPSPVGITAGDIRLTAGFGFAAGTTVTGNDDDLGRGTAATAFAYKFFDADGNGVYNPGDTVFAGGPGAVAINDVALNGATAFTRVALGNPLFNVATSVVAMPPVGLNEMFFNADGIAGYGITDDVYLSLPGAAGAAPRVGDIRLTGLGTLYAGGTTVIGSDVDITIVLAAAGGGVCFTDVNGDTLVSAGEPMYIQFTTPGCGPKTVVSGDYRLLATAGKLGGTIVTGADDDSSRNTIPPPAAAAFAFFDADGSTTFTKNDPVYLHFGAAALGVSINDVILTGAAHNTQVSGATAELNNALTAHPAGAFGGAIGVFNADGLGAGVVTTGDYLYLPTVPAAGSSPGVNTVRLTQVGTFTPGTYVGPTDVDIVVALAAALTPPAAPYAVVCFIDVNADGIQGALEPAYLKPGACGTGVAALNVRLTANAPYQAGTLVSGADDDFARPLTASPAAAYLVYDADASGAYTNGEALFVDFGAAIVSPNDIAVTTNQFVRVTAGTAGLNNPLVAPIPVIGTEQFFDADGSGAFTPGDTVYLDMDFAGAPATVTVGDIRLTGLGTSTGVIGGGIGGGIGSSTSTSGTGTSGTSTSGTGTSGTSTSGTGTSGTSTSGTGTSGTGSSTTKSTKTPGFELVALVGALGAALILVRRKL